MDTPSGRHDAPRPPLVARVPWWVPAVVGIALLVLGVAVHGRILQRGGPYEDGVVLLVAAWLLWQWQHRAAGR